ncbi:DUF4383 domain-containing protein [Amycolatopsis sp. NPDC023774]|uniref:DUF4383 domain-containing protein n=1 Tax=Amycolatopsis sp. NPDC023774 TaxID=3155015 RepID=UPI0033F46BD4
MSTHTSSHTAIGRSSAQVAAGIVAVVFLLVGILGFIPGSTTDYHQMSFAGYDSTAMLFGVFMVSTLRNIVHLLFDVVGGGVAGMESGYARPTSTSGDE